jgi:hypothetical protein
VKREYNEHIISIQYHILSAKYSYYTLSLSSGYTKGLNPKHALRDVSEFTEVISFNIQYILFALEENGLQQHSKHVGPSIASNSHQFGPPTNNPHWHH